ncbi:MAG: TlpA family protein disulfide reductase [Acidobacteria bacterium]|nr:TlpA family protein disulfide reductase [Acidobacteriota bacterium]MBK8809393.1 TlpA family protein disulfide reductase [Acidobacteriota bacterium]
MKSVVLLVLVLFVVSACSTSPAANSADPLNGNTGDVSKSKYPPVGSAISKAENRHLDGSVLKIEDKKGKTVLLNLWATWCGPCREEIPHLVELQEKYKDKGLEVIGLDVNPESKEEIEKFMAEMKINYTIGWAHEDLTLEVMRKNQMSGIPQTILINREGQLTGVFRGGGGNVIAKMKQTVAKVVNE